MEDTDANFDPEAQYQELLAVRDDLVSRLPKITDATIKELYQERLSELDNDIARAAQALLPARADDILRALSQLAALEASGLSGRMLETLERRRASLAQHAGEIAAQLTELSLDYADLERLQAAAAFSGPLAVGATVEPGAPVTPSVPAPPAAPAVPTPDITATPDSEPTEPAEDATSSEAEDGGQPNVPVVGDAAPELVLASLRELLGPIGVGTVKPAQLMAIIAPGVTYISRYHLPQLRTVLDQLRELGATVTHNGQPTKASAYDIVMPELTVTAPAEPAAAAERTTPEQPSLLDAHFSTDDAYALARLLGQFPEVLAAAHIEPIDPQILDDMLSGEITSTKNPPTADAIQTAKRVALERAAALIDQSDLFKNVLAALHTGDPRGKLLGYLASVLTAETRTTIFSLPELSRVQRYRFDERRLYVEGSTTVVQRPSDPSDEPQRPWQREEDDIKPASAPQDIEVANATQAGEVTEEETGDSDEDIADEHAEPPVRPAARGKRDNRPTGETLTNRALGHYLTNLQTAGYNLESSYSVDELVAVFGTGFRKQVGGASEKGGIVPRGHARTSQRLTTADAVMVALARHSDPLVQNYATRKSTAKELRRRIENAIQERLKAQREAGGNQSERKP
ncbi:MAG TPA: hypothetical protein VLF91_00945 [Candidatus Saccharimonadales bacterium]|nr:hypothetical protein [Candidatus Saccharimonadales bacterium]